ncbi:PREDICTED: probable multidrug resistance-associated protein lethal(2)03659 [Dufourea novaeangliae]|uniref:probable multidrug resistance-associated protein lethal(2)03659 n=1 Tax=Dufourea novaeangliae TaxID=178035 RepID=UPI000767D417|nr:PREDICTED: probable multidrug resistance-associated protein lethal(2)03659 [Dufourea novaeangliae]
MEPKVVYTKRSPKETTGPLSRLFFGWTRKLFLKGTRRNLTLSDLYCPMKSDESEGLGDRLATSWERELQKSVSKEDTNETYKRNSNEKGSPLLALAVVRAFWPEFIITSVLYGLQYVVLQMFQPILQSWIISYFKGNQDASTITKTDALIYAGSLTIVLLVTVSVNHHADLLVDQMGMKIRVACCSLIYRKMLRLSRGALTHITSGQIVNLISNDVSRFDTTMHFVNFMWITPVQTLIVAMIVWDQIGLATIVTCGSLFVIIFPVIVITNRLSDRFREIIAVVTDTRVQLMHEVLTGIQVIKMYAWEKTFAKILSTIRAEELKKIKMASFIRAVHMSLIVIPNRLVLYLTLLSYVLMGNQIQPNITFMLVSYFQHIQLTLGYFVPVGVMLIRESLVSLNRIEQFLLLEEQSKGKISSLRARPNVPLKFKKNGKTENSTEIPDTGKPENIFEEITPVSVALEHVYANWVPENLPPTLCNVSMQIRAGELFALVGSVGSGKSSIIHLLLREISLGAGKVKFISYPAKEIQNNKLGYIVQKLNLKVSYASQEPWLFSGSVRQNILFGLPYDRERYVAVTKACALTRDFQQLPYGDMTNVGENGSSLSGGQKARVNLARAVYRQADIYLLDDPLSAVDARVAKHLFQKCIREYLRGKTRVLVTHQVQFLKEAHTIAVMDRGSVRMQGSYDELSKSSKDFTEIIEGIKMSADATREKETEDIPLNESTTKRQISRKSVGRSSIISTASSILTYNYEIQEFAPSEDNEEEAIGRASANVYLNYFKYGGSCFVLAMLVFVFIVSQVIVSGNDYWVSYWTNLEVIRRSVENGSQADSYQYSYMFNNTFFSSIFTLDSNGLLSESDALYVYAFCIVSCIVIAFGRGFFFMQICMVASRNIHNSMFWSVLQTTMSFFHRNSTGRIMNRFSKDVGTIDELLPLALLETVIVFCTTSGIFIMIVIVSYWMIVPLTVLLVLIYVIRLQYLKVVRRLKRLEGIAKSPVFSHMTATLEGLSTIKTSGSDVSRLLQRQFDQLQDVHTGAWYMTLVAPSAFGLYLDIAVSFVIGAISFSFILLDRGNTLGGTVGLALSQAFLILGTLPYGIKKSSDVVAQMISVERILEYVGLPSEGNWETSNPPPADWPNHGQVILKNVSLQYEKNEAPVLKNLNVTIEPGWKVGVVGRTGAGKSSLISALFRLFPEGLDGQIKVDGIDVSTVGLHEFRTKISIIPQQPFLFTDTVRNNLDPFNSYDDTTLWDSLHQVELNDLVLDQKLQYSGGNLSIGQKQLICLARAVLKNNRILILDEATANIDNQTDALIQKTIRTRFSDCTVITVAHRLNTIIDCDRIIVMDAGCIAEFGCPHELLRDKPNGIFSTMVANTGPTMAKTLREQAERVSIKNKMEQNLNLIRQSSTDTDATDIIAETVL